MPDQFNNEMLKLTCVNVGVAFVYVMLYHAFDVLNNAQDKYPTVPGDAGWPSALVTLFAVIVPTVVPADVLTVTLVLLANWKK